MKRNARIVVALAAVAMVTGVPAYLALNFFRLLPPPLRDQPWPLGVLGLAMVGAILFLARRSTDARERRIAFGSALLGAISLIALVGAARAAYALPHSELPTGKELPELSLRDESGRVVSLASLRGKPVVFIFYRGAFCAYCRKELSRLSEHAQPFMDRGVHIFAVSADPPDVAKELKRNLGLPFDLLSDEEQRLAVELCGVNAHCEVIADERGVVRWVGLNDNWRVKLRPDVIFQAAYRCESS